MSALRINRNDPESLRSLAAALGSLVNKDFGTVRLSAVKDGRDGMGVTWCHWLNGEGF